MGKCCRNNNTTTEKSDSMLFLKIQARYDRVCIEEVGVDT
jgi:hypothetical protein